MLGDRGVLTEAFASDSFDPQHAPPLTKQPVECEAVLICSRQSEWRERQSPQNRETLATQFQRAPATYHNRSSPRPPLHVHRLICIVALGALHDAPLVAQDELCPAT